MSAVLPPELSPRGAAPPTGAGSRRILSWFGTVLAAIVFVASTGGWVLATYYDAKIPRILGIGNLLSGDSAGPMTLLEVRRLGLQEETEAAVRTEFPDGV